MRRLVLGIGVAVVLSAALVLAAGPDVPIACMCSGPAWWCAIYCGLV